MVRGPGVRSLLRDESWRYALLGGLIALLGTTATDWRTGSTFNIGAVFVGGLLAGALFTGTATDRARVGVRVGLIGGVPLLWMGAELVRFVLLETSAPVAVRLFQIAVVLPFVGFGFGIAAFVARVGARIGDSLRNKFGRNRPSVVAG